MSIWAASLSMKSASKLVSLFSTTFSGALANATFLTLLLKSFVGKKRFSRSVLTNTPRFLRFFSLETFPFLAPDGITDFGIALAKHCNLVFCSFVLQIDWSKTFSDGSRNNMCCNKHHMFMMKRKNSSHWRESFHHRLPFMTKKKSQFRCGYVQMPQIIMESLIKQQPQQNYLCWLKHANSIVFAIFVQYAWCTSR